MSGQIASCGFFREGDIFSDTKEFSVDEKLNHPKMNGNNSPYYRSALIALDRFQDLQNVPDWNKKTVRILDRQLRSPVIQARSGYDANRNSSLAMLPDIFDHCCNEDWGSAARDVLALEEVREVLQQANNGIERGIEVVASVIEDALNLINKLQLP